jgi:hypothetical protein
VAITNPATNVASSSATLNGSVDPHGLTTTVHFQYGTTTSYGHATGSQTKTGNAYQNVAANISGLSASTPVFPRFVALEAQYGSDGPLHCQCSGSRQAYEVIAWRAHLRRTFKT